MLGAGSSGGASHNSGQLGQQQPRAQQDRRLSCQFPSIAAHEAPARHCPAISDDGRRSDGRPRHLSSYAWKGRRLRCTVPPPREVRQGPNPTDRARGCFIPDSAGDLRGPPEKVGTRWLWKRSSVSLRARSTVIQTPVPGSARAGGDYDRRFLGLGGPVLRRYLGRSRGDSKIGLIL